MTKRIRGFCKLGAFKRRLEKPYIFHYIVGVWYFQVGPQNKVYREKKLIPLEVKKIHQQTKEKNVDLIPNAITHPKFSLKLIGLIMGNCTLLRRFIQDHH